MTRKFFQRTAGNGFAREQPVDAGKFFAVSVVGVSKTFDDVAQRAVDVRLQAAVQNMKIIKAGQHTEKRGAFGKPTVADRL